MAIPWYRSIFLASPNSPNSKLILKSNAAVEKERRRQISSGYYAIHPFSSFRIVWDFMISLVILTVTLLETFALSFEYLESNKQLPISYMGRVIFSLNIIVFVDILINFYTGFYDPLTKCIVLDWSKIIYNYAMKRLTTHCFFGVPWYFLAVFEEQKDDFHLLYSAELDLRDWFAIACMTRLLRFPEISNYLLVFKRLSIHHKLFYEILNGFMYTSFLFHFSSCLQVSVVGLSQSQDLTQVSNSSWLVQEEFHLLYSENIVGQYAKCFYRSLTSLLLQMDGVTINVTTEDRMLTSFLRVMGVLNLLYIVSCFLRFFRRSFGPLKKIEGIKNFADEMVRHKQLPQRNRQQIAEYIDFKFHKNLFFNEANNITLLSKTLQKEIQEFDCREFFEKVNIMKFVSKKAAIRLRDCLKEDIYLPGYTFVRIGTYRNCLYFLRSGTLSVQDINDVELAQLRDGACFGTLSLFFEDVQRCYNVEPVEPCEIQILARAEFLSVMLDYPDELEAMKKFTLENMPLTKFEKKVYKCPVVIGNIIKPTEPTAHSSS